MGAGYLKFLFKTIMSELRKSVGKRFHGKRIHRSAGAIAGFASALSVLVGVLAGYATPKGWGRVSMALHLTKKPLIMKLAPILTGVSVAVATLAGLLGFYLWVVERPKILQTIKSTSPDRRYLFLPRKSTAA